jgi:hypothetical protein
MPGTDLIPFEHSDVTVPDSLSLRFEEWPGGETLSVIVTGPLGAVELQLRPSQLAWPGGGMSLEYHSHQPRPGADTARTDCPVLDGTCYGDGGYGNTQAVFEPLFRAGNAAAIVAELVDRYTDTTWSYGEDTAVAAVDLGARVRTGRGRIGSDVVPLTPDPPRYRLELVQVGLGEAVSAAATQLDGAMRGSWLVTSHLPLEEFLALDTYEIPAGTPLVRLDRADDDVFFSQVLSGPHWLESLPAGHVQRPLGQPQRYAGEPWSDMPRWYVAPDVYAALAPTAGVVIEHLAGNAPTRS